MPQHVLSEADEVTRIRADYARVLSDTMRWQLGWLPDWATHRILAQDFVRLDRLLTRRADASRTWQRNHPTPERRSAEV